MTNDDAMAEDSMTFDEFGMTLERLGADLDRWPPKVRARAEVLIANDAQARRIWDAAKQIDVVLANLPVRTPSADLRRRVAEIPMRIPQHRKRSHLPTWRLWFPTFATLMGLGVWVGLASNEADMNATVEADRSAVSAETEDWVDSEDFLLALNDELAVSGSEE